MWVRRLIGVGLLLLAGLSLVPFPQSKVTIKVDLPPAMSDASANRFMEVFVALIPLVSIVIVLVCVVAGVWLVASSFRRGGGVKR